MLARAFVDAETGSKPKIQYAIFALHVTSSSSGTTRMYIAIISLS
jgi:hypothetical protein